MPVTASGNDQVLREYASHFDRHRDLWQLASQGALMSAFGHEVCLIPPQYVKPYVKRGKNDAADAEALCEAVSRPSMRFVPV